MRLTEREVKLIAEIPKRRRERKIEAWLGLAFAIAAFIVFQHLDPRYDSLVYVVGIALGFTAGEVARVYFRVTPEDKLIAVLQRYINRDPEAVRQFSTQMGHRGDAV